MSIVSVELSIANLELPMQETFGRLISQLAQVNIALWHEEDHARVDEDHEVARAKRKIDILNQQRNDLIEKLDELVMLSIPKK